MKKKFNAIFLIAFVFLIISVGFVTAVWYNPLTWFDNNENNHITTVEKGGITKIYDNNQKNLKIKDKNKVLIDLGLISPQKYLVEEGEDVKVAEFYLFDLDDSINNLFDLVNFYEIDKGFKKKNKDYWFKYGVEELVYECYVDEFEKEVCDYNLVVNWIRFNSLNELPNKNLKIGMFVNTMNEKEVEWIPTLKGFDISEWASYEVVTLSTYHDDAGNYSIDGIQSIFVSGDYLYTSSTVDDYVSIMNITDKTNIIPVSTYHDIAGNYSIESVFLIFVSGDYLYTSSYVDDYVSIMNISNKSEIVPVSTYHDMAGNYSTNDVRSFFVSGDYLYTSSYAEDYVSIMNISNKSEIVPLSTYHDGAGNYSVNGIFSIFVSGDYLYTSSYAEDYVSIMNISNKSEIVPLSTYHDDDGDYSINGIRSIFVSGDYLYTTSDNDDYVSIMNISNKSEIVPLSTYHDDDGDYSIDGIRSIFVSGDYLYTSSDNDDYVSMMNISNKSEIVPLSTYHDIAGNYSIEDVISIFVSGNYLYTCSETDDYVSIMNFSNPIPPYFIGNYSTIYNVTVRSNETLFRDINATDETSFGNFSINWSSTFIINGTTGILKNTSPLSVQNYLINNSINDTAGNYNWTYVNVTVVLGGIDYTPPLVALIVPTNTSYNSWTKFEILSNTDPVAQGGDIDRCWGMLNTTTRISYTFLAANVFRNITYTPPESLSHNFTAYCNDSSGNLGVAASSVMFELDTIPPYFTDNYTNWYNISMLSNQSLFNDLNATDETAFDSWFMNWTAPFNLTKGSGLLLNTSPMVAGNYLINVSINDTLGNLNWTYVNVTVIEGVGAIDTTPPYFIGNYSTMFNITFSNSSSLSIWWDFNAGDDIALDSFFMNWTLPFNLTKGSGILINLSEFDYARNYLINISINDTTNNINWTYVNVTIVEGIVASPADLINCGTFTMTGFRLIMLIGAIIIVFTVSFFVYRKYQEGNLTVGDIIILFITIIVALVLWTASGQNLAGACGNIAT